MYKDIESPVRESMVLPGQTLFEYAGLKLNFHPSRGYLL